MAGIHSQILRWETETSLPVKKGTAAAAAITNEPVTVAVATQPDQGSRR